MASDTATLGGGCFWCLEAIYQRVNGITKVSSGYSGGYIDNPTTEQVYAGGTGHAEVVQLQFDPKIISFKDILEIFFVMHDPTTLNRQGNDVGEHYRSVIFYHDQAQKKEAEDTIANFAAPLWPDKIVTQVQPYTKFWPAGPEHQDYYNKNSGASYCQLIINPKIIKLRQKFAKKLKPS